MSKTIKVVFAHGTGGISGIIEAVEELGERLHGDNGIDFIPTHCGLIVDDKFQEALIDGFVGENIHRYDLANIRIYNIEITEEGAIKRGDMKFTELLGQKYSIQALVCGAAYTIFNMILPGTKGENDCSGDDTEVLRAYGLDISGDVPASSITPNILMSIIDKIGTLAG